MKLAVAVLLLAAMAAADEVQDIFSHTNADDVVLPWNFNGGAMQGSPVNVAMQLLTYTNKNRYIALSDGSPNDTYSCRAPNAFVTGCQFVFSAVLNGNPSRNYVTKFLGVPNNNGFVNISAMTSTRGAKDIWAMAQQSTFTNKPNTMVVTVMDNGPVYDYTKPGNPVAETGYFVADIFTIPMAAMVPYTNNYNPWPTYTTNTATSAYNNTLTFRVSLRCATAGMFGPMCGLTSCAPISNNLGTCRDPQGNTYSCQTAPTVPNQYTNCKLCPGGVLATGACKTPPTTTPSTPGKTTTAVPAVLKSGVSKSFKSATIALAIILVLLLVIAIGLFVRSYMTSKKDHDSEDFHGKRNDWAARNDHSSASSSYTGSETETGSETGTSASTTPRSEKHGFKAIPDTPDRDHLAVKTFHGDSASSRSTSRRSSQVSHDPAAELQSAHSSLPDGGRTTPRLEARV